MSKNKKTAIYNDLLTGIKELQFKPNDFLNETELATQYNVSRTPVRQVLQRLENEKYIIVLPHYGNKVARINLEIVKQAIDMRILFETSVLHTISYNFKKHASTLKNILKKQEEAISSSNLEDFWALDNTFHKTLFELANRKYWWEILESSDPHYMRYRKLDMTDSNNNVDLLFVHHKNIISALEDQDYDKLEPLVSSHAHLCLERMPILLEKYTDYFVDK